MSLVARRTLPLSRPSSLLRPLRLPRISPNSSLRLFTQNHPLLLITRASTPRPQLPFLSQPSHSAGRRQTARFLTTENKNYVKEQVWLAAKWSATGWTLIFLLAVAWYGVQQEVIERQYPSPDEWSFFSRNHYRCAHAGLRPEHEYTDWAQVATEFRRCLERLENDGIDGKDTVALAPGQAFFRGVDPSAYDISNKSYPWREGYFQVVMQCARASEHLDGMVLDTTRKIVFPKDTVVGPSNPNPRPCPPGAESAPLEENCEQAYAAPETFYLKVLTGIGFSTRQRVDAALAYANWLDIQGLEDSAEETYQWALDIAASALPNPDTVIDKQSSVIRVQEAAPPSPNLLRAATNLATHRARSGNVTSALPIYLSVLRARHAAPIDFAPPAPSKPSVLISNPGNTDIGAFISLVKSLFTPPTYPAEPPSGDEPFLRQNPSIPDCSEAELMLYIGEILFATAPSGQKEEGLGWTKQAVSIAEKGFASDSAVVNRKQCKSCLDTGISNWSTMVSRLLKQDQEKSTSFGWTSWFSASQQKEGQHSRWEDELRTVEEMRMRLISQGINSKLAAVQRVPGGVWMG